MLALRRQFGLGLETMSDEANKRAEVVTAAILQAANAAINNARHDIMLHQTHQRGRLHRLTNRRRREKFHHQARECASLIAAM
jgi:hypothetical protein